MSVAALQPRFTWLQLAADAESAAGTEGAVVSRGIVVEVVVVVVVAMVVVTVRQSDVMTLAAALIPEWLPAWSTAETT